MKPRFHDACRRSRSRMAVCGARSAIKTDSEDRGVVARGQFRGAQRLCRELARCHSRAKCTGRNVLAVAGDLNISRVG